MITRVSTISCPECTSEDLSWELVSLPSPHAPLDGRMGTHDVVPSLVLGCSYCSHTVKIIQDASEVVVALRDPPS